MTRTPRAPAASVPPKPQVLKETAKPQQPKRVGERCRFLPMATRRTLRATAATWQQMAVVYGFSMVVHAVVLIVFGFIILPQETREELLSILADTEVDIPDPPPPVDHIIQDPEIIDERAVEDATQDVTALVTSNTDAESSFNLNLSDEALNLKPATDVGQSLPVKIGSMSAGRSEAARRKCSPSAGETPPVMPPLNRPSNGWPRSKEGMAVGTITTWANPATRANCPRPPARRDWCSWRFWERATPTSRSASIRKPSSGASIISWGPGSTPRRVGLSRQKPRPGRHVRPSHLRHGFGRGSRHDRRPQAPRRGPGRGQFHRSRPALRRRLAICPQYAGRHLRGRLASRGAQKRLPCENSHSPHGLRRDQQIPDRGLSRGRFPIQLHARPTAQAVHHLHRAVVADVHGLESRDPRSGQWGQVPRPSRAV